MNIFYSLKQFFRDCKYGIKNIFIFLPAVWQFKTWDKTYLYRYLVPALAQCEKEFRNSPLQNGSKYAREMQIMKVYAIRLGDESLDFPEDSNVEEQEFIKLWLKRWYSW